MKGPFVALLLALAWPTTNAHSWPMFGQNVENNRFQHLEGLTAHESVGDYVIDWTFNATGDVICTPTEQGGLVYFTDERSHLYAVDEDDGELEWEVGPIGRIVGARGASSHTSPLITENFVIIGTSGTHIVGEDPYFPQAQGSAILAAFWKLNGTLAWTVTLDRHDTARIDQSPIEFNGFVWVGTSSFELHLTSPDDDMYDRSFDCCSFSGTFFKINVGTGEIVWQVDLSQGGTGAPAFGSTAAVHGGLGHVFVSTGLGWGDNPAPGASSVQAYTVADGDPVWTSSIDDDDWFAQGPVLGRVQGDNPQDPDIHLVMAASVGGKVFAWDAATGDEVWTTDLGGGGMLGGSFWGSATDGTDRMFVAIAHGQDEDDGGFWYALNIADGSVMWETQVPVFWDGNSGARAWAWGAVSYANNIVFAPAMDKDGTLFALNADNGKVLNSWETGGTLVGGASISNGRIFVGSGFKTGFFSHWKFQSYAIRTRRKVHSIKWHYNP